MTLVMNVASLEYVKVPVEVVKDGVVYDPTSDAVKFTFVAGHDLTAAVWTDGSWETTAAGDHYARCLVGPTAKVLAAGRYNVFVKVTDNPEIPARDAGQLVILG